MSTDTPDLPPDLKARLREEPTDTRADLKAVWDLLGAAEDRAADGAAPDAAWDTLVRRYPELDASPSDGTEPATTDRTSTASVSRRRARSARPAQRHSQWRLAAGLALATLVLIGGLWLWRQPVTVTAPAGTQHTATLPDGSTVELNSGTTLTYRREFQTWPLVEAAQRRVRLDGEAFFEVADGTRRFAVTTANAQVTVTGTRFNVRARTAGASPPKTDVAVVEGQVQVAAQQRPEAAVQVEGGHTSRVADPATAPTPPQPTSVDHILAWRNNGFAARAQPLRAVVQDLERRYDAVVHIHTSVDRPQAPISLYYPGPTDLETILHDLCTARDLNYRPTSRGFEIFAASGSR